jgi:hypothetical protein
MFEEICRQAAGDAGIRTASSRPSPRADHPVILTIPESRYLTGLLPNPRSAGQARVAPDWGQVLHSDSAR